MTRWLWPVLVVACERGEASTCPARVQRIDAELRRLEQVRAVAQPFELDASAAWDALVATLPTAEIESRHRSAATMRVVVGDALAQAVAGELVDCDGPACFAALASAYADAREVEGAIAVVIPAADVATARVGGTIAALASVEPTGRVDLVIGRGTPGPWTRVPTPPAFVAAEARMRAGDDVLTLATLRADVYVDCALLLMPAELAPPSSRDRVRLQLTVAGIQACGCEVDDDAVLWAEALDLPEVPVVVVPLVVRDDAMPWPRAQRWADGAKELAVAIAARPDEPIAITLPP